MLSTTLGSKMEKEIWKNYDHNYLVSNLGKVWSIRNGTDVLGALPAAPKYFSREQKKHWFESGQILVRAGLMKEKFVAALELFAVAKAQFEWAIIEINKKIR